MQYASKEEAKQVCLNMVKALKVPEKQFRLGSSLILLKREAVEEMEKKRLLLLVEYAITLQRTVRRYVSLLAFEKKQDLRRNFNSILQLQSILRRSMARPKYAQILEAVQQAAAKKRMSFQVGESDENGEVTDVDSALASLISENIEKKDPLNDSEEPICEETNDLPEDKTGDEDPETLDDNNDVNIWKPLPRDEKDVIQPLYVRIQVQANGRKEALLFNVERLVKGCKASELIKLHKGYLHTYPFTFSGPDMLGWLSTHAANALFGDKAWRDDNKKVAHYVANILTQKMRAMGIFLQVRGSRAKTFEDPSSLFRLYDDEKREYYLNCQSIWFRSARDPVYVVSELLYKMINLRLNKPDKDFRKLEEFKRFTLSSAELQFVNINEMSRQKIIAFYLNAYNLMVLHAQAVLGYMEGSDFSNEKVSVKYEYQYRIAVYNYTLAEIEERLLNRILRSKLPANSEKARAPEPRVHFALSMVRVICGCLRARGYKRDPYQFAVTISSLQARPGSRC